MKRTLEQSRTFFKRDTANRGFGRELYQTPIPVIHQIVEDILYHNPWLVDWVWVDPCAGDGRWEEVIRSKGIHRVESYDLNPLNDKIIKKDFFTFEKQNFNTFILGNPPFSMVKQFVDKALSVANCCYFLGGSQVITGTLSPKAVYFNRFEGWEGNQKDKRSKIKFVDTNGKDVLVWCCGAFFDTIGSRGYLERSDTMREGYFRTSVKSYTKETDRVVPLSIVDTKRFDFLK